MGRITIPLYYCKSKVPLVLFRAGGDEKCIGFIDTGSEVSMFDFSLVDKGFQVGEISGETNFVGVNGEGDATTVHVLKGDITMKTKDGDYQAIDVAGITYDFSALTDAFRKKTEKDISISAIFGSDFLKEHNAKIDYKNKILTIDALER